jgi:hypothetical protein
MEREHIHDARNDVLNEPADMVQFDCIASVLDSGDSLDLGDGFDVALSDSMLNNSDLSTDDMPAPLYVNIEGARSGTEESLRLEMPELEIPEMEVAGPELVQHELSSVSDYCLDPQTDLIVQMNAMPQDAGLFNTEDVEHLLLSDTPTDLPPPNLDIAQPLPSLAGLPHFQWVLPVPVATPLDCGAEHGVQIASQPSGQTTGLPMPLNPPVKRTVRWVHCNAQGREPKPVKKEISVEPIKKKSVTGYSWHNCRAL